VVLRARPDVGAVTLALPFGLFNLICGTWMLAGGIELRRTGQTLRPVPSPGRKERGLTSIPGAVIKLNLAPAGGDVDGVTWADAL
jgi:hypothetical protein